MYITNPVTIASVTKGYLSYVIVLCLLSYMVGLCFPELEKIISKFIWRDERSQMAKAQEIQEFINRMKGNERAIAQNKKLSVE